MLIRPPPRPRPRSGRGWCLVLVALTLLSGTPAAPCLVPGSPCRQPSHTPVLELLADRLRAAEKPHEVVITAVAQKRAIIANALCKPRLTWTNRPPWKTVARPATFVQRPKHPVQLCRGRYAPPASRVFHLRGVHQPPVWQDHPRGADPQRP